MIKFLINLYRENIPYFIAIKNAIDQMLEFNYFKTIAIGASIIGAIRLIPRLPKIIDRLIRKISTWGRY